MVSAEATKRAEEVLRKNPRGMAEFMERVRADPDVCRNLYKDCPEMQKVLSQNPSLKKIFEDPVKMRAGFEAVYKKQGGEPPRGDAEDDWIDDAMADDDCYDGPKRVDEAEGEEMKKRMAKRMKHLQRANRVKGCVSGVMSLMSPVKLGQKVCKIIMPTAAEDALNNGADAMDRTAADRFDEPEVAEELDRILESDQNIEEAIEENDDLRRLRDENPLVAQMAHDPEAFRTIMEPDNLRACTELNTAMEQDFMRTMEALEGGGDGPPTEVPQLEELEPRSAEQPTSPEGRGECRLDSRGGPNAELQFDSMNINGADLPEAEVPQTENVDLSTHEGRGENLLDSRGGPNAELHYDSMNIDGANLPEAEGPQAENFDHEGQGDNRLDSRRGPNTELHHDSVNFDGSDLPDVDEMEAAEAETEELPEIEELEEEVVEQEEWEGEEEEEGEAEEEGEEEEEEEGGILEDYEYEAEESENNNRASNRRSTRGRQSQARGGRNPRGGASERGGRLRSLVGGVATTYMGGMAVDGLGETFGGGGDLAIPEDELDLAIPEDELAEIGGEDVEMLGEEAPDLEGLADMDMDAEVTDPGGVEFGTEDVAVAAAELPAQDDGPNMTGAIAAGAGVAVLAVGAGAGAAVMTGRDRREREAAAKDDTTAVTIEEGEGGESEEKEEEGAWKKKSHWSKLKAATAFVAGEATGVLTEFGVTEVLGDDMGEAVLEEAEEMEEEKEEEDEEEEEEKRRREAEHGGDKSGSTAGKELRGADVCGNEVNDEEDPKDEKKKKGRWSKLKSATSFVAGEAAGVLTEFGVMEVMGEDLGEAVLEEAEEMEEEEDGEEDENEKRGQEEEEKEEARKRGDDQNFCGPSGGAATVCNARGAGVGDEDTTENEDSKTEKKKKSSRWTKLKNATSFVAGEAAGVLTEFGLTEALGEDMGEAVLEEAEEMEEEEKEDEDSDQKKKIETGDPRKEQARSDTDFRERGPVTVQKTARNTSFRSPMQSQQPRPERQDAPPKWGSYSWSQENGSDRKSSLAHSGVIAQRNTRSTTPPKWGSYSWSQENGSDHKPSPARMSAIAQRRGDASFLPPRSPQKAGPRRRDTLSHVSRSGARGKCADERNGAIPSNQTRRGMRKTTETMPPPSLRRSASSPDEGARYSKKSEARRNEAERCSRRPSGRSGAIPSNSMRRMNSHEGARRTDQTLPPPSLRQATSAHDEVAKRFDVVERSSRKLERPRARSSESRREIMPLHPPSLGRASSASEEDATCSRGSEVRRNGVGRSSHRSESTRAASSGPRPRNVPGPAHKRRFPSGLAGARKRFDVPPSRGNGAEVANHSPTPHQSRTKRAQRGGSDNTRSRQPTSSQAQVRSNRQHKTTGKNVRPPRKNKSQGGPVHVRPRPENRESRPQTIAHRAGNGTPTRNTAGQNTGGVGRRQLPEKGESNYVPVPSIVVADAGTIVFPKDAQEWQREDYYARKHAETRTRLDTKRIQLQMRLSDKRKRGEMTRHRPARNPAA